MAEPVPEDLRWGALKLNLRWGAVFFDRKNLVLHELYLDAGAERGTIDNKPYKFDATLLKWFQGQANHPPDTHQSHHPWRRVIGIVLLFSIMVFAIAALFRKRPRVTQQDKGA
ncbi:MAG TPA: hypothetical protein VGW57_04700 [Chthoniobacterales bacterium]|nr:hypothetical protein [Chthoniobacterales bacterium]